MMKPKSAPTLNLTDIPQGHGRVTAGIASEYSMIIFSLTEDYHTPGKVDYELLDRGKDLLAIKFRDKTQLMALKMAVEALIEKLEGGRTQ